MSAVGFLDGWWTDFINVIVVGATIVATGVSVGAIIYTSVESRRSKQRLADERRRSYEIETLGRVLASATSDRRSAPDLRTPVFATIRTLSSATRALIPMTSGFFDPVPTWRQEMHTRYSKDTSGKDRPIHELALCHFDVVLGDDGKTEFNRTIMNAIWDELVSGIDTLVSRLPK